MPKLDKSTLNFLKDLSKNNDRDWFNEHKPRYQEAQKNIKALSGSIKSMMDEYDLIEKVKVFRIYRDVRFSKDKTPYKNNLGCSFIRATELRRGGFYLHIEPGNVFVAGGFWQPASGDLKRIRQEIDLDAEPLKEIINDKSFVKHFGGIAGEQLKTSPRDYSADHPEIELLRYKQFLMTKNFTDKEALSEDFADKVNETFTAMMPFQNLMSVILTTDINGVPLS